MDYEKKYKEALERARVLMTNQNPPAFDKHLIGMVFPELAESEDERMRKEIIDFLRLPHPQFVGKRYHEKWIAWLEKQGEQHSPIDINKMVNEFAHTKVKGYGIPRMIEVDAYRKGIEDALKKQGVQKTKSKFKVRDWIVDDLGYFWRVTKVLSNYYELEGDDGVESMPTIKWTDEKFHLWTIDDAKKGDILVVDGIWIVEFDKKRTNGCPWNDASILTSFEYDMDDDICTPGSHIFYKEIWPASMEDIDLFKKKRNDYLASNSHNESKFKVGDKVTVKGDNTVYTIDIIAPDKTCWLTHEGRAYGWATFGVLKHYVEQ